MPRHVVDLDAEPATGVTAVEMDHRPIGQFELELWDEHDTPVAECAKQLDLEIRVLRLRPCRPLREDTCEPSRPLAPRSLQPPAGGEESRDVAQLSVDHLLNDGLEALIVEKAGEIECEPSRAKHPDAVGSHLDVVREVELIRAVHDDTGEPRRSMQSQGVDVGVVGHLTKVAKPGRRRSADDEVRNGEARSNAPRRDGMLTAAET